MDKAIKILLEEVGRCEVEAEKERSLYHANLPYELMGDPDTKKAMKHYMSFINWQDRADYFKIAVEMLEDEAGWRIDGVLDVESLNRWLNSNEWEKLSTGKAGDVWAGPVGNAVAVLHRMEYRSYEWYSTLERINGKWQPL